VPPLPVNEVEGAAFSADGRELALAVRQAASASPAVGAGELGLYVYSLPGGTVRTWSLSGPAAAVSKFGTGTQAGIDALSWLPDGTPSPSTGPAPPRPPAPRPAAFGCSTPPGLAVT
jgi:hypothetical protein